MIAILAAVMLAAAPQQDTVFTADGGRMVGTVVEEGPQGVTLQLPDGTTRRFAPRQVVRIEYADGSVSTPSRNAPPPAAQRPPPPSSPPSYYPPPAYPPPGYAPPPTYAPPPPTYRPPSPGPPSYAGPPRGMPPAMPFYGVFGLGGSFMSGMVERGFSARDTFDPQLDLWLEGGMRLVPQLGLGLYLDIGVGEPASMVRNNECAGISCSATTGRFGVLLRHTFNPYAYTTPWLGIGTAYEWGSVNTDNTGLNGGSSQVFSYSGWEVLRLMAGWDVRSNPVFGFGFYGGVAFGTYSRFEDATGTTHLSDQKFHTTVQGGLRFTLFP